MLKSKLAISRRAVIAFGVAELGLFLIANVTAKSSSSPGTVSNVAWFLFLFGLLLLVVLGIVALVRNWLSRSR